MKGPDPTYRPVRAAIPVPPARPLPPARPKISPAEPRRCQGTVRTWDDEKGFGFIEPEGGGADVFLHVTALADRTTRPAVGATVTYRRGTDLQQRPRAVDARLESGARRARPVVAAGAVMAGFIGGLGIAASLGLLAVWVPVIYLVLSSLTFASYAWDKLQAERGFRRTPESTLHLLEALGGWPGALVAQHWLRHKVRKVSYQVVFWLIASAHIGLWTWLAMGRPGI